MYLFRGAMGMSVFTFLSLSGASVRQFATLHRPWFRLTERKNRHSHGSPEQIRKNNLKSSCNVSKIMLNCITVSHCYNDRDEE